MDESLPNRSHPCSTATTYLVSSSLGILVRESGYPPSAWHCPAPGTRNIQKHPETQKAGSVFGHPNGHQNKAVLWNNWKKGRKKTSTNQWFYGFRPHLHRHQLVDTGIMMYNAAPILPLAFEAFMIPCIRALPTPGPRPKKPSFMSISPRWCWICLGLMPTIISPSIKNSWQVLHDITRMFECYPMNNTIFNRAHHVSLILLLVIYFHTAVDLLFFTHRWCLSAVVSSPLKHPPKKHNGSPIREGRLRGIQLMQQDLAGVHGLKDGHLIPRMRTAIELKFPIGLKICVSICVYIYISLSFKYKYIYISLCARVCIHMRLDLTS